LKPVLRSLLALAFVAAAGAAAAQTYSPADQEKLRAAGLPLLPGGFHNAAAVGNLEQLRKFLAAGLSTELRDRDGRTPLLLALESSMLARQPEPKRSEMLRAKIAAAQFLLDRGADARARSNLGFNALHTAANLGDMAELMELLISRGADVKGVDAQWFRTPLFVAANASDLRPMEVLLRRGADPNARDLKKWTPLLMSVLGKNAAAAARLVEAGADPTLKNDDGVSALEIATKSGDPALIVAMGRR
jgi:ankyrin repeat protein